MRIALKAKKWNKITSNHHYHLRLWAGNYIIFHELKLLTLWRRLLPVPDRVIKAVICNFWYPDTLMHVKSYKRRLNPVWHRMLYSCTHVATVGVNDQTLDPNMLRAQYLKNDWRQGLRSNGPPTGNGIWGIEWSCGQWRHVSLKGQDVTQLGLEPNILKMAGDAI